MKTRFNLSIKAGTIKVDELNIEFPGIEIVSETEFNIAELDALYDTYKKAIQEFPKLMMHALEDTEAQAIMAQKRIAKLHSTQEEKEIEKNVERLSTGEVSRLSKMITKIMSDPKTKEA